ncbi:MAG TPA: chromosome partition protein MukB, partial [Polyangiaceae bacterium]|nr:chromosome partition protein MukB [Polyangiaceae bacterium]
MNRARAYALHLVNWKGVFLERYLLDRHVTALEGANGAGKTTVMIAAYVALLPDLSRLKFVNVGEAGATGGDRGIWGRLGEAGPSYTALEIELEPGERVLCGVHIERKTAPALAFTPFLVPKLPANLSAEQLWLRQSAAHEEILDLKELATHLGERGAKLEVLGSAKEYFARLFELGIGALRLGTDEERNKFNDMLRTSMTGGISRTLTNDLRSFLFKQETALFDTLSRMRQNLDACRRTRLEVSEARQLEQEINGIHAAGHAMFEAALGATRAHSKERQRAADLARDAIGRANELVLELETTEAEIGLRQSSLGPRLSRAESAESAARERLAQLERACAAAERVRASESARDALEGPLAEAQERKARASAQRDSARADRDAAQATLLRAAAGLADLQAGLEELHRQSHAFGRVRAELQRARELLAAYAEQAADAAAELRDLSQGTAVPSPAQVRAALERARSALETLDRERAERHRQQASAERNAAELARVRAALALLSGSPDAADTGIRARAELARLNELELLSGRSRELETEYRRARALADRQAAFRAELAALGIEHPPSAQDFALGVEKLEQQWREAEQCQREHELGAERASERARASEARQGELEGRSERYRRLAEVAQRLRSRGEEPPQSASELAARVRVLEEKKRRLQAEAERLERERSEALAAAQECETSSAGPDRELVALAERVDG